MFYRLYKEVVDFRTSEEVLRIWESSRILIAADDTCGTRWCSVYVSASSPEEAAEKLSSVFRREEKDFLSLNGTFTEIYLRNGGGGRISPKDLFYNYTVQRSARYYLKRLYRKVKA